MQHMRIAVIGTGFIGRVHARAARLAGAEIIGVAAGSDESAARAARELGAGRTYSSPGELAADDDVDLVHICTPNDQHAPYAGAALAAGKHVICEKPLGIDLAEAEALRDQARGSSMLAAVPFVYRFHPMVRELRARIATGELGRLRLLHGGYYQDWLAEDGAENWRMDPARGGASRAFADIGSHWCDLMEYVTGDRIARLCASLRLSGGTDEAATMQFVTRGGATGVMLVTQISQGHKNRLLIEIDGSARSAVFDQESPDVLRLADARESRELHRGDAGLSDEAQALSLLPPGHPQGYNDAFALFVQAAYDAARSRVEDGVPTFEDGARAAGIVDAVLRSASSDSWVEIAR